MSVWLAAIGAALGAVGKGITAGASSGPGVAPDDGSDNLESLLASIQQQKGGGDVMQPTGGLTGNADWSDLTSKLNSGLDQGIGSDWGDFKGRVGSSLENGTPMYSGGLESRYGAYRDASENPFGGLDTQPVQAVPADGGTDWKKLLGNFFGGFSGGYGG